MIIGVSGKIASGKDLTGEMIKYIGEMGYHHSFGAFEQHIEGLGFPAPTRWNVKKFADALKDNVCRILGCTRKQLEDRGFKNKELGEEWWYHEVLPEHGFGKVLIPFTGSRSEMHLTIIRPTPRLILQRLGTEGGREVIHTNIWVNAAMAGHQDHSNWIFTDMRFPNELEAVASRGGVTIRVVRGDGDTGNHPSEIALDDYFGSFDYIIENNGSKESLYNVIVQIMIDFNLIN